MVRFFLKGNFFNFLRCRYTIFNFTILYSRYSAGTHFTKFATKLLQKGNFSKTGLPTESTYL